jgi:sugar phosphate isomerase/epimerase
MPRTDRFRTALEIGLGWGALAQASPDELVDAAAENGFASVTVRPATCLKWCESGGDLIDLRARAERSGVRIAAVDPLIRGLPGIPEAAEIPLEFRDAFVPDETDCRRIVSVTRARRLNVAHFLGRPAPLPELAAAIGALCRRLAPAGCLVSLEFIPGTGIPDLATAQLLCRMVSEPNLGVLLDTWHFARSGGTPDQVRQLPQGMIVALQLNDWVPAAADKVYRPMSGRLLPGDGELPLAALLQAALENNPELDVELEVFNAELRSLAPAAAAARIASSLSLWLDGLPTDSALTARC